MRRAMIVAAVCGVAGCAGDSGEPDSILVFAAASLTDALSEVVSMFEGETGASVTVSFAGSGTLAQQIAGGAEADLFISADRSWIDWLDDRVEVVSRTEPFGNALVLVTERGNPLNLESVENLAEAKVGRIAIGDPSYVPAGMYAVQALIDLGLWSAVEAKTVRTADVRQALLYAQRGEVDAAIVYRTDALATADVERVAELDVALHDPVVYSAVLLTNNAAAREFLSHLASEAGTSVFEHYGFDALAMR